MRTLLAVAWDRNEPSSISSQHLYDDQADHTSQSMGWNLSMLIHTETRIDEEARDASGGLMWCGASGVSGVCSGLREATLLLLRQNLRRNQQEAKKLPNRRLLRTPACVSFRTYAQKATFSCLHTVT